MPFKCARNGIWNNIQICTAHVVKAKHLYKISLESVSVGLYSWTHLVFTRQYVSLTHLTGSWMYCFPSVIWSVLNHGWVYSSSDVWWLQCCCSKTSTSPLRARLLALPWNRPFFPAPFPWSISNTLQSKETHSKLQELFFFQLRAVKDCLTRKFLCYEQV